MWFVSTMRHCSLQSLFFFYYKDDASAHTPSCIHVRTPHSRFSSESSES
uniref:Uncharacterized protein n=1 Tax=Arundo donax TaxID=35708 RepID=A0A0A8YKS1_ARUDO